MDVAPPVVFAEHFGLQHRSESFPVQKLVPELAVETLAAGVLPLTAGFDVEGFETAFF